jgi:hypothetical protein
MKKDVTIRVKLRLNEVWASNLSRDELVAYIRQRLKSSLGFRAQIKELRLTSASGDESHEGDA